MKFTTVTVTRKDGSENTAEVADPQNLQELVKLYGEKRPFILGRTEYFEKIKKKLRSGRSRKVVVRIDELTPKQQELLRQAGLLPAA